MQIVIDIPQKVYDKALSGDGTGAIWAGYVKNGTLIPEITAEMFRNGCLESIEALMAEGKVYDIDYTRWIPISERLPEDGDTYLVTIEYKGEVIGVDAASYSPVEGYIDKHWDTFNDWKEDDDSCYHVTAWMPLPEGYNAEE